MVPAPLTTHQLILSKIYDLISDFVEGTDLGMVLFAPVDVVLSNENVVQPDLLFIAKNRMGILKRENIQGAPDLVVEILSEGTKKWDLEIKRKLYEKYGVREYWIVDPEARSVEVLQSTDEGFTTVRVFTGKTRVKSPLLEGFGFDPERIF